MGESKRRKILRESYYPPSLLSAELMSAFRKGVASYRAGQIEKAELLFRQIIEAAPQHFDSQYLLGEIELQRGNYREAVRLIDKALRLNPNRAFAHVALGAALCSLERHDESVASYDRALAIDPDNALALFNRGTVLAMVKRFDEALASYDKALAIKPDTVDALVNRGNILVEFKRLDEALASYDKALAIRPDSADLLKNRGVVLAKLKRLDEALASYDKALAIRPDYVEALVNRGSVLVVLERLDEALASYDRALEIRPGYADALNDRGWLALLQGRYAEAWGDYESRSEIKKLPALWPKWKGEGLREKRIIVYEEQGLGDIIQCCRFLTLLAARGGQVTFLVRSSLHRLLGAFAPAVRLVDKQPSGEIFDFQSALMSLPGGLDTTLENIPADIPYLYPEEPLVALWRERLGSQGFKVGVCWQGSPDYKDEPGRSIPLRCFQTLARIPGVRLISLQKHHGLDQFENLPSDMRVETLGQDFDSGPDAFVDTAAVMSCLDLVITSDTSIAHLAGALGRPVWVALKQVPHWLWMLGRTDSPWYPTMTLYRQEVRDDWTTVFRAIAEDLAKLQERGRGTARA